MLIYLSNLIFKIKFIEFSIEKINYCLNINRKISVYIYLHFILFLKKINFFINKNDV